jgi:hypothetical protein
MRRLGRSLTFAWRQSPLWVISDRAIQPLGLPMSAIVRKQTTMIGVAIVRFVPILLQKSEIEGIGAAEAIS